MAISDFATTRMQELHGSVPLVRFGTQYAFDAGAWGVALFVAEVLRYEFELQRIAVIPLLALFAAASLVQFFAGGVYHLYQGRHIYGSFAEVRALLGVVLVATVVLGLPIAVAGTVVGIPRSTVFIALPMAFVLMGGVRYIKRLLVERSMVRTDDIQKALIFGAGYMGASIARRMTTDRNSPFLPVGIIDDDPLKRNLWLHGVRVLGSRASLSAAAQASGATTLVVAIARADATLLRQINDAAKVAHLKVLVLPPLEDLLNGKARLNDLRDIAIEDLIGRHPVDTHVASIAGYLAGKRVLVTGAGGSIGSELCRQINKFGPSELIMLDRDETGLQSTQISILGHGLLDTKDVVLADIRDSQALKDIFTERRPDVVFHAAALKHLPMLEQYPDEAWKTNVLGTLNVLEAAQAAGVTTFVNISTDKAANPTSVLGHSKRVAEKLTAWAAEQSEHAYLSVRFGNVIGSRGSMLPTFTTLIEAGGPLTITHPDVTRFFMTIPEACQLVIQAGGIGRPAEVLILDMGEPVRILDVAQRMIEMSGKEIEIVYTGLRPGEKLHEELIGENETDERPIHPKISHASIAPIHPNRLDRARWAERCNESYSATLGSAV
ncbi:nucleoside-diphosphate sugar epimerase/dehydratase [Cryobacterium sp. PH31-AA6]|uniref:polysaccharide biosynthesis protein n=1 Tax=Cryobacterium sp. PH31-AA6 TaxID=3046205 RepID=UPI0024BB569D|nr:nucleoside-diphosphate sugar epimerase/dehydratase [Cryobacterium sp. PH31-AA6]MDJ0323902.1 nucleoside-diphosphate sugar epimerase/dehydratase [Cryobacterium sp. PH31-AA6]